MNPNYFSLDSVDDDNQKQSQEKKIEEILTEEQEIYSASFIDQSEESMHVKRISELIRIPNNGLVSVPVATDASTKDVRDSINLILRC